MRPAVLAAAESQQELNTGSVLDHAATLHLSKSWGAGVKGAVQVDHVNRISADCVLLFQQELTSSPAVKACSGCLACGHELNTI